MVKKQKRKTRSELRDETRNGKMEHYKNFYEKAEGKLFHVLDPCLFDQVFVQNTFLGDKLRSYLCKCDIHSMITKFDQFRGNPGLDCPHCSPITKGPCYISTTRPNHYGYLPFDDTACYYQAIYMRIVDGEFVPWSFPDELAKRHPTYEWGWRIPKNSIYSKNERNGRVIETWREVGLWEIGPNQTLTHLIAPLSVWLKILERRITDLETSPQVR